MLEVIDSLHKTRDFCKDNSGVLDDRFAFHENCFHMIANATTLAIELLNYYKEAWTRPMPRVTTEKAELILKQRTDKVNEITRWAFIAAVSSAEFSSKILVKRAQKGPLKSLSRRKRLYLSQIMDASNRNGIIDSTSHDEWAAILKIRNNLVHNNAIADHTRSYSVSGVAVSFIEGQMLQGNLLFFSHMIHFLALNLHGWLRSFLETHAFA